MSAPTIHQRVHGWLWHWSTGPGWCRDGSEMAKLRQDGMRVIRVQLQDDGLIPPEQVQEWKDAGLKVWGAIRPSGDPLHAGTWSAQETAQWANGEKKRLALDGLDFNFEDEVRAQDVASGGAWSQVFTSEARRLMPTLPMHLDTYYGSAAGGINLGAYLAKNFRYTIQTYWGAEDVWSDPPTNIVRWMAAANPPIPKAIVKPLIRVAKNSAGELPDWNVVFADWKRAGLIGGGYYYIDACDFDFLRWLVRETVARGCAF